MTNMKAIIVLISGLILCLGAAEAASANTVRQPPGPRCVQGVTCCVPGKPCWIK